MANKKRGGRSEELEVSSEELGDEVVCWGVWHTPGVNNAPGTFQIVDGKSSNGKCSPLRLRSGGVVVG